MALAGRLDFDPQTDTLTAPTAPRFASRRPSARSCRPRDSTRARPRFVAPPADGSSVSVAVSPTSDRLQLLEPFAAWDGKDYIDLPILLKAKGKCTTDHISMAGPWLKYRGHLENISGNLFIGAVNAFTGETGEGKDQLDGTTKSFPDIAKHYHQAGQSWVAIGDENMGEGSSREHAAMEPRFRGAKVVITRSFARIHETNLKKQGVLPLTFADPADYDKIGEDDRISVTGLAELAPNTRSRSRSPRPADRRGRSSRTTPCQRRADRVVQGRQRAEHHPQTNSKVTKTTDRVGAELRRWH